MSVPERTIRIDPRFNGPPGSGNGGYVCGELAKAFGPLAECDLRQTGEAHPAPGVRVRLMRPVPLDRDLRIIPIEDGYGLFDGATLLAQAWSGALTLAAPGPVVFEVATQASRRFRGFASHPIPHCFVCGSARAEADGLRIFPGAVGGEEGATSDGVGGGLFAAPWRPDPSLAGADGNVDPSFLWAALDCPGCFSFPQPEGALVLLGEMMAALSGPVAVDEACVLLSWQLSEEGRKHRTGTALYGEDGDCRGIAHAIWIEVSGL